MGKRLEGKVAIVTGAAAGMGKAFCIGLAKEGAKIVAADIRDVSGVQAAVAAVGGSAMGVRADVSVQADVERMVQETVAAFGRVDILINNAGIYPVQSLEEITLEDWRRVLAVNLDGVFFGVKAVVPHMKKQKYGRIVNISSTTFFMGVPIVHYVAAKGGVIGITRALAGEVGEFGITVNCIAPGLTRTEGVEASPALLGMWDTLVAAQSIKRKETADDVVGAVTFLASDESAFITGQTLCVDGGWTRH